MRHLNLLFVTAALTGAASATNQIDPGSVVAALQIIGSIIMSVVALVGLIKKKE